MDRSSARPNAKMTRNHKCVCDWLYEWVELSKSTEERRSGIEQMASNSCRFVQSKNCPYQLRIVSVLFRESRLYALVVKLWELRRLHSFWISPFPGWPELVQVIFRQRRPVTRIHVPEHCLGVSHCFWTTADGRIRAGVDGRWQDADVVWSTRIFIVITVFSKWMKDVR